MALLPLPKTEGFEMQERPDKEGSEADFQGLCHKTFFFFYKPGPFPASFSDLFFINRKEATVNRALDGSTYPS
jgi:hypothetical protein